MTADTKDGIEDAAIDWHIRCRDADSATWEAFTRWLGEDVRHLAAYDAIVALDLDIEEALMARAPSLTLVSNENAYDARSPRRWWIGGALAASAAALVAILAGPNLRASSRYEIATAPGQTRTIAMGDGTQITLNGATRMTFDRRDKRFAALESGEAVFIVRHDPAHPFALDLGAVRVSDVGTVFNVVRESAGTTVEVREGSVLYDVVNEAIPVKAGQSLRATTASSRIVVTSKRPESIATWREGRLDYGMESFAVIARDLSRNLGTSVIVDPALAERRFSGTIALDRNHKRLFARLGALLGVTIRQDGASWRMSVR